MNQLPDNPMSALRLMPSKTKEIAVFVHGIVKSVKEGYANPLEVLTMLRALEHVSREVREEIQENINTEADKYSEKKFEAFGAIIERCDVKTEYDYASSRDVEWEDLNTQILTLTEKRKEREAFLRALKQPVTAVNEQTGEEYTMRPPIKRTTPGVKIYLK